MLASGAAGRPPPSTLSSLLPGSSSSADVLQGSAHCLATDQEAVSRSTMLLLSMPVSARREEGRNVTENVCQASLHCRHF